MGSIEDPFRNNKVPQRGGGTKGEKRMYAIAFLFGPGKINFVSTCMQSARPNNGTAFVLCPRRPIEIYITPLSPGLENPKMALNDVASRLCHSRAEVHI